MKPDSRVRLNSPLLPALVGVLLLLQLFFPYDGWLVLLVGLGAGLVGAYLWAAALARGLSIRREMRFGWAQVGDRLEERFTLTNHSLIPALWVEVEDQTSLPDYYPGRATGVGSPGQSQWVTQGVCTRRGLFRLGPTTLRTGDPLNIFRVELHAAPSANLLVTPPIVPLPQIEVSPGGRSGEGRPRPDAPERTVASAGVRQYAPGDSLRWIHWPTSARRDDLYVRLFDGDPAGDWWLILDVDRRCQAGRGQVSTEEHGVILAASLAERGIRLRRAVGLAANSLDPVWLPPKDGDAQLWEALRRLALVTPGDRSLGELLARLKPSFGRGSSLVIITPNLSADWLEQLLPLVWAGATPTLLLLDQASFDPARYRRGDANRTAGMLSEMGIANTIVGKELLDRPEARPGQEGRWEWRVSLTGRAVAVKKPRNLDWKTLS